MRRLAAILALAVFCLIALPERVAAQYYTWGADAAGMRWHSVRSDDFRIIYPDTACGVAARTMYYIRAVQPHINYGFTRRPMSIPFVLHPENFRSNGLVMYLPKRVEFLTSPDIDNYAMPWTKHLVAHEYRHAAQYNNLNQGLVRVLSYLLGQQGSTIGLLCMPIWAMEGDAVMYETASSSFGRAMQPSFSMGLRAIGAEELLARKNSDKWFCGSYRDYVPDHYELGYQLCAYAYDRYNENIWNKTSRFGARNIYMFATTAVALRKYYGTSVAKLYRETFQSLDDFWRTIPTVSEPMRTLLPLPERNHTTYRWPLHSIGNLVIAYKKDFDRPGRFVLVDPGHWERRLAWTGDLSTRPAEHSGRLWWTEYRRSKLFEQRINSQLCYMDLNKVHPRSVGGRRHALYPTPMRDSLAWVEYAPDGRYSIHTQSFEKVTRRVNRRAARATARLTLSLDKEVHGLAWDECTAALYLLITDDAGMSIARLDGTRLTTVKPSAYVTLSGLRADHGRLCFTSIASGRDEAHILDLATGAEYRATESNYGSFDPATSGNHLLATTYDKKGYRLTAMSIDTTRLMRIAHSTLPRNLVNPPHRRWEVPNLDLVRFTPADSLEQSRHTRARRYTKGVHLANIHSWMPVAFDPFSAVDEHVISANAGITLISQNLLSSAEAFASYGWNHTEGSIVRFGLRYFGLGLRFDVDATYGGNQQIYRVGRYNEETQSYEYQKTPSPDRYYSVGVTTSLPLIFQQGYHTRSLTLAAGWNYSNGMVARMKKITWAEGQITNLEHIGFSEGLHKIDLSVAFADQVQMAYRDIAPRWGYRLQAGYAMNPANDNFSNLVTTYAQVYMPGVAAHHSLRLAASYQTSFGGYKFPSGYAPLSYRSKRLVPQGFTGSDILANNYTAIAADYQLPVWYPEGGIPSVVYFKRLRLNVGASHASFRDFTSHGPLWRRLWSVGGDLLVDFNAFRQPASATSTLKISVYYPSNKQVWYAVSFGLPF